MVHPNLLALVVFLVLLPVAGEGLSRYRGADPETRRERLLVRTGGALLILALVGFDGVFGLIPDPGVTSGVATAATLTLYGLALACFSGVFWLRRHD